MADKTSDPVALWQQMIGEMEKGFNAFANQAMSSPEFSKAMNQAGGATAGAQRQFGEFMEKYLLNMNLPSRAQSAPAVSGGVAWFVVARWLRRRPGSGRYGSSCAA